MHALHPDLVGHIVQLVERVREHVAHFHAAQGVTGVIDVDAHCSPIAREIAFSKPLVSAIK